MKTQTPNQILSPCKHLKKCGLFIFHILERILSVNLTNSFSCVKIELLMYRCKKKEAFKKGIFILKYYLINNKLLGTFIISSLQIFCVYKKSQFFYSL